MSASVHAGMPYPPPDGEPPAGWKPLWDGEPPRMENPPGWRTPPDAELPPQMQNPPSPDAEPPLPPGKQTPAYGLRAAGTHPTGMHTCLLLF